MTNNIAVIMGDITTLKVDIIVNASNIYLRPGGGVSGAIYRKGGQELVNATAQLNGCDEGEAKITDGYNLLCKKVIHTVGPQWHDGNDRAIELLKNCYINSMKLAEEYRIENNLESLTIAFPCISTGTFGFPKDLGAEIAVETIRKINNPSILVVFVCYDNTDYQIYVKKIHGIDVMYLMS